MTIRELVQVLGKIEDQDALVMTSGYEGGFCDVTDIADPIDMALNVNNEWYYGNHERAEMLIHEDREKYQIVKAIVL